MDEVQWQRLVPIIIFMVIILLMFWWIIIKPTTRRQREHRELIDSLEEGDRIVTVGGLYGEIVQIREDEIDVEVAEDVIITLDRRGVRRRRG